MKRGAAVEYGTQELVVDVDTSALGVVWAAGTTTLGLMLAALAAAFAGYAIEPVAAIGLAALSMAVLTVAASIHNPRYIERPALDEETRP